MNKSFSAFMAALAVCVTIAGPARAEDAKEMAVNSAMFPVRILGVASGMALGIPVAMTRRMSSRSIEYTETFAENIGGKDSIPPMVFASVMGIPFGLLVGAGEGMYFGGKNAIESGSEKPFSLASFSLDSELE